MAITVREIDVNKTLDEVKTIVVQTEQLAYEIVSLTVGSARGNATNLAVFRQRALGPIGPLNLLEIDGSSPVTQQELQLSQAEASPKRLVSYGSVFVGGVQKNIAILRG